MVKAFSVSLDNISFFDMVEFLPGYGCISSVRKHPKCVSVLERPEAAAKASYTYRIDISGDKRIF